MARLEVMRMNKKVPADLHRVEPIATVNVNVALMLMGSIAIMLIVGLLFNFMMDDFNLLLLKSI